MRHQRGAVNVEYILLLVMAALAVILGLAYLSGAIDDKHSQVGGAISEKSIPAFPAAGGGGGGGTHGYVMFAWRSSQGDYGYWNVDETFNTRWWVPVSPDSETCFVIQGNFLYSVDNWSSIVRKISMVDGTEVDTYDMKTAGVLRNTYDIIAQDDRIFLAGTILADTDLHIVELDTETMTATQVKQLPYSDDIGINWMFAPSENGNLCLFYDNGVSISLTKLNTTTWVGTTVTLPMGDTTGATLAQWACHIMVNTDGSFRTYESWLNNTMCIKDWNADGTFDSLVGQYAIGTNMPFEVTKNNSGVDLWVHRTADNATLGFFAPDGTGGIEEVARINDGAYVELYYDCEAY